MTEVSADKNGKHLHERDLNEHLLWTKDALRSRLSRSVETGLTVERSLPHGPAEFLIGHAAVILLLSP